MRSDNVGVEKTRILGARPSPSAAKSRRQPHPQQNGPKIEDLDILAVWKSLGGEPLRSGRGRAFWRNGEGYNAAIDATKGTWFDHASGMGGGILALVENAIGCDRRAALQWLAVNFRISTGRTSNALDHRNYVRRLERARELAAELVARRDAAILSIQAEERKHLDRFHGLQTAAYEREDIELLARAEEEFSRVEVLTARRDELAVADVPTLARLLSKVVIA